MFILSSSAPTTTFFTSTTTTTPTPKARVSFSSFVSSSSVRFCTRRQPFPSLFHSFKASAMAEMLQDKESPAPPPAATTSPGETSKDCRTFLNATTEQGSLALLSSFFSASLFSFLLRKMWWELTKTEIPNYFVCSFTLTSCVPFF